MHTEVLRAELPSLSCQTAPGSYMLQLRDWWLHCRFSHGIGIQKNIRGGVARYDPSSSSCSSCSRAVHVGNPLAADGTARRSLQPAMPALWAERCMPTRIPDKILPACHNERRGERRWREGGRRARRLLRARQHTYATRGAPLTAGGARQTRHSFSDCSSVAPPRARGAVSGRRVRLSHTLKRQTLFM